MLMFVVEDRGHGTKLFNSLAEAKHYAEQWAKTPVRFVQPGSDTYRAISPDGVVYYTIKAQEMDTIGPVRFVVHNAKHKPISPEFEFRHQALTWLADNCKPTYPREFYVAWFPISR